MSIPKHRTAPQYSYFVTTKSAEGRAIFQVRENAQIVIDALYRYREKGAYLLHEFVLMPDHLHLLLTPLESMSLEKAMQLIKGGSSFEIHKKRGQKMEIWQKGFHDWTIRDADDWRVKSEYVAMNPVRAHLVQTFRDWPYSSAFGKFILDPMPAKYLSAASGAKAPGCEAPTQGLKPLPPKEKSAEPDSKRRWRSVGP
ncbi:MAG TPA: transposase [Candidatus Acidoferrum sp.]|nr:transposase [Candidatus Acidoferrum sp.]